MNTICYSSDQIQHLEKLGKGDRSVVYKDPNRNKALKIYKKNSLCFLDDALRFVKRKQLEEYDVIIPQGIVCVDGVNKGYYSEIVNGYTIQYLESHTALPIHVSDFEKAYERVHNNTVGISQLGYQLWDLHEMNLMYDIDKKRIMFIDVDAWHKKRKSRKLENRNLFELEASIDLVKIKKHLM